MTIFSLFFLNACKEPSVYEKFEALPKMQWTKEKSLEYVMPIADNSKEFKLISGLRFVPSINHKAILIKLVLTAPSGKKELEKSYTITIKDENDKAKGEVMGDIADVEQVLEEKIKFAEKGNYNIKVYHEMQAVEFGGLQQLGIILRDIKK